MARRSIESRCDRIMAKILPPGSYERRVYELPPEMKQALELYQTKTDAIILRVEKSDPTPGAAYERLLRGDLVLPVMPGNLRDALGLVDPPEITESMSPAEVSDAYRRFVEGDQS